MAQHIFDTQSARRIIRQTLAAERTPTDLRDKQPTPTAPTGTVARFRLLERLEFGKTAPGRMLVYEKGDDELHEWVQSDREDILFAGSANQTYWAEGAEVTALLTPNGWCVTTEALMATASDPPVAYGTYAMGNSGGSVFGNVAYGNAFLEDWEDEYFWLGAIPDDPPVVDSTPDGGGLPKLWPAVTDANPRVAAYNLAPPTNLSDEVLDALGWTGDRHPAPGEYWGPGTGHKLSRAARVLPLYWYKYTPPPWVCMEVDDPAGTGTIFVWSRNGEPYTDDNDEYVLCSEPEPPTDPVYLIAPNYWWNSFFSGGFGWNGWGLGLGYPYWYNRFNPSLGYYGGFGNGWWGRYWGGYPPSSVDLDDPGTPMPSPGGGWTVEQLCEYAFVVYQFGWRVFDVDQDNERAFIVGELKFFTRLAVVNADPEDCDPVS